MSASKVSDLLPIPEGVKHPHAYQVFGLEAGEADSAAVKTAIAATIARLKEHKDAANPKAWRTAAKLVQQAQSILTNPKKRSELDAQFGIVDITDEAGPSAQDTNFDPLAGMLPTADPLADILPPSQSVASAPMIPPPGAVPIIANGVPVPDATPTAGAGVAIKRVSPQRRRRSNSNWLLGLLALGLIAIIGLLAYFVFYGPGELAITKTDGSLTIRTGASGSDKTVVSSPTGFDDPRPRVDPVMPKSLANGMNVPVDEVPSLGAPGDPIAGLPPELENLLNDPAKARTTPTEMKDDVAQPSMTQPSMTQPSMTQSSMTQPSMTQSSMTQSSMTPETSEETSEAPETMMQVKPPTETGEIEMAADVVAATQVKIEQLRRLIRDAKWKEMTPAASELKEALMTDEQRKEVEIIYELADLAAYYYGAIQRGIAGRQAAETIDVSDALKIAIVEVGPDLLVIRYAGKNKSYTFDELPLILAHRMAEFALPSDNSTNLAAKACYQALAPKSNDEDRKEAMEWLGSIGEDVPGAHPQQIVEIIKQLMR